MMGSLVSEPRLKSTIAKSGRWRSIASSALATEALVASGALSLDGLITHRRPAEAAAAAYETAFGDPACLKMILDWTGAAFH